MLRKSSKQLHKDHGLYHDGQRGFQGRVFFLVTKGLFFDFDVARFPSTDVFGHAFVFFVVSTRIIYIYIYMQIGV